MVCYAFDLEVEGRHIVEETSVDEVIWIDAFLRAVGVCFVEEVSNGDYCL